MSETDIVDTGIPPLSIDDAEASVRGDEPRVRDAGAPEPCQFVQLDLPVETIEAVDSLAEVEFISRNAWTRRLVVQSTMTTE